MDETELAIVLGLSLLPPLLFAVWVRAHERHDREPMLAVLGMFLYGGTLGVGVALALSLLVGAGFREVTGFSLLSVVLIAPIVEEFAKGLGLGWVRHRVTEPEDGIIYGAAIGLGFGATENVLYGLQAFAESGIEGATWTISLRVFSSVLLHAGSTALLGYGYARVRLSGRGFVVLLPFYLVAVVQHALYNFLVNTRLVLGFSAAVVMVLVVTSMLRRQIRQLDARPALRTQPPL